MKKLKISSALIAFFMAFFVVAANAKSPFVENEILVKYKHTPNRFFSDSISARLNATIVEEFPELRWQRLKLPLGTDIKFAIGELQKESEVELAQPNFYYHILATPNDPSFGSLYGMTKISAPAAWDTTTGDPSIVVADIDTGIRYTHQDLVNNIWRNTAETPSNGIDDDGNGFIDDYYGWDFFYNDNDPLDQNGHGTHTTGTIGAVGNNMLGVAGVNWNVKVMAIKIYSPAGTDTTSTMLINAYNYVRLMKNRGVNIRVTNNSYGGCLEACGYDQATKDAIDAVGETGILQAFAAGNDGVNIDTTPFYPAGYTSPSIISVASSTSTDTRSGFSSWGLTSVDLAAPGSGILSTTNGSDVSTGSLSGTSMATPHVAGAAALMLAANSSLSGMSLKASLMNRVDPLATWTTLVKSGGRLNVAAAIQNPTVCDLQFANPLSAAASGETLSVNVTVPANCDYSTTTQSAWITITSTTPKSGSSTINLTIAANTGAARSGQVRIGDKLLAINQASAQAPIKPVLDFDGDGKTDLTAVDPNGVAWVWHTLRSQNGYNGATFGSSADDILVPGYFDNDSIADIAVWRRSNGVFYILKSTNGTVDFRQFGMNGDNPLISQDFDGDSLSDTSVVRATNGALVWHIMQSASGYRAVQWGADTDKPVRGDFDGDGKADAAVFRPSTGVWYILGSTSGFQAAQFGAATDIPVPGDYNGDQKWDIAVWRPSTGVWHILTSGTNAYGAAQFGTVNDKPTPGDFDGDGKTDLGVWRPNAGTGSSAVFYLQGSTSGFQAVSWGSSDMTVPLNQFVGN